MREAFGVCIGQVNVFSEGCGYRRDRERCSLEWAEICWDRIGTHHQANGAAEKAQWSLESRSIVAICELSVAGRSKPENCVAIGRVSSEKVEVIIVGSFTGGPDGNIFLPRRTTASTSCHCTKPLALIPLLPGESNLFTSWRRWALFQRHLNM